MTVFVYVSTSKPVGDVDDIKVFANPGCRGNVQPLTPTLSP